MGWEHLLGYMFSFYSLNIRLRKDKFSQQRFRKISRTLELAENAFISISGSAFPVQVGAPCLRLVCPGLCKTSLNNFIFIIYLFHPKKTQRYYITFSKM